jgi:hypothetical protein
MAWCYVTTLLYLTLYTYLLCDTVSYIFNHFFIYEICSFIYLRCLVIYLLQ